MKNLYLLILIVFISSCSKELSDEELLQKDRGTLKETVHSGKVLPYKFIKIAFRASDPSSKNVKNYSSVEKNLTNTIDRLNKYTHPDKISPLEYYALYSDYKKTVDFIEKTDEDDFTTCTEIVYNFFNTGKPKVELKGKDKKLVEAHEHALLSLIAISSAKLGAGIALYEADKTDMKLIPDGELKAHLQFCRGVIFLQNELYYLGESEYTNNLNWLEKNQNKSYPMTREVLQLGPKKSNEDVRITFEAYNYLLRGLNRFMMEREIDQERALEDFEKVIDAAHKLKYENEAISAIEIYVYLKKGEDKKAINSINQLKKSKYLTPDDKEILDESITYIKKRDNEKVLTSVYDKTFMLEIIVRFSIAHIFEGKSEKIMKKYKVPHAKYINQKISVTESFVDNINRLKNGETIKETGKDVVDESKSLYEEAKDYFKK
jgi:HPt (histidine-containing phosphotransfer) domain-containing protein